MCLGLILAGMNAYNAASAKKAGKKEEVKKAHACCIGCKGCGI